MTQDPSPQWLDSLSSDKAPPFPVHIAAALRARRRERRMRNTVRFGVAAALLAAISTAWVMYVPASSKPSIPVAEATFPPILTELAEVTVASVYGDRALNLDRLASAPAADERQFRIGDHWDPERVEAWVLD
jgi:hypothetical protein